MYIVRWLIGHPIAAVLVLAVVALLLAPGSDKKGDVSDDEVSLQKSYASNSSSDLLHSSEAENLKDEKTVHESDTKQAKDLTITETTTDKAKAAQNVINGSSEKSETSETTKKITADSTPLFPPVAFDDQEVKKAIASESTTETKKDNTKNTATADLGEVTYEEMLLMAREAYWNNGLDEAAQIYKKLIEAEPKVLEHKGELGNVYWRQGYPQKAAELYSEISIPMIENGHTDRVANMIGFIGLYYPDRAAEIQYRMQLKK